MDYYQGWFDLKPGVRDTDFARGLARYMTYLKDNGLIEGWKLMRRKLGLAPPEFADFHLVMETRNLAQLDPGTRQNTKRKAPELHCSTTSPAVHQTNQRHWLGP